MNAPQPRKFEFTEAKRSHVPLLIGYMGPSGGGKTYSALRTAVGIQRVNGGDIYMIDTEARRGLHYADRFKFKHAPFAPPFGPLDYLDVIRQAVKAGAGVVIVDSMSHEHEGQGGVLDTHDKELERLTKGDAGKRDAMNFLAWQKPKSDRRKMINELLQMEACFIFCFRAKEKIKLVRAEGRKTQPVPQGFMPIAGEELVFEMTVNALLLPRANGVPTWRSDQVGERLMMKLPEQFKGVFIEGEPLTEDIGEKLATWAKGGDIRAPGDAAIATEADLQAAARKAAKAGKAALQAHWKALGKPERTRVAPIMDELKRTATDAEEVTDEIEFDDDPGNPESMPDGTGPGKARPDDGPTDAEIDKADARMQHALGPGFADEPAPKIAVTEAQARARGATAAARKQTKKAAVPPEWTDPQVIKWVHAGWDDAQAKKEGGA